MTDNELNLEQMESVSGGKSSYGGYSVRPKDKAGFIIIQIRHGDNLSKIASAYDTTVKQILADNPCIIDPNKIMSGYYLYIRA